MEPENFSPEESLKLIQTMIHKTRQDISRDSSHFLIWGWITFVAFLGQFILKNQLHYEKHYLVWLLVFPGIIISIIFGKNEKRSRRASSYSDDAMKYLWMGMGISFFVLSMILSRMGWDQNVYPFFIMMYGLGTFVSGNFLRFRPLVAGGICAWVLAIVSTWFNYDYQMLVGAAAILFSYIIPAYLLRRKNNHLS